MVEIEVLMEEIADIKKRNAYLQNELDQKHQQLWDSNRKLSTALAIEKDYQQEIETLQLHDKSLKREMQTKVQLLEEQIEILKEQIEFLNEELLIKNEDSKNEVADLKNKLKTLMESEAETSVNNDENSKLVEENIDLKKQLKNLMECNETILMEIEQLKTEKTNITQLFNVSMYEGR